MADFDIDTIPNNNVIIAVNRAAEIVKPTFCYTACRAFVDYLNDGTVEWNHDCPKIVYSKGAIYPHDYYTVNEGVKYGGNSGYSAITFAIALGCSPIYLVGFDMKGSEGEQKWFHDGYPIAYSSRVYPYYIPEFTKLVGEIYNCNFDSALTCFKYAKQAGEYMEQFEIFVTKEGYKKRFPISPRLTGGKGIQHWLDKGFQLLNSEEKLYQQQDLRTVLKDNSWAGRRCFIVGGGPSAKEFDFDKLKGELSIAVNRSFDAFDPTILFSADNRFWEYMWNADLGEETTKRFDEYKGIKVAADRGMVYPESIKLVQRSKKVGYSFDEGIMTGGNSGFAALNLAIILGAAPIYLIGFDMKGKDGKQTWHHKGYPHNNGDNVYEVYRDVFEREANAMLEHVDIYNLSPISSLNCFDKVDFPKKNIRMPLVVAHYTSEYEGEVEKLKESLDLFGLEYELTPIESFGSWRKNSNYVVKHIIKMLNKHRRSILRVDADAIFREYPTIFSGGFKGDFAAHIREGKELLGGTLFFKNNAKARAVLKKWSSMCDMQPGVSNQVHLGDIVRNKLHECKAVFTDLPASYTKIFDTMQGPAVIEHMQASRRLKDSIK